MDTLLQDLRFALRTLRRTPGVAVLAVFCMALGIGAVTSMYSTATAFIFHPLPQVHDPEGLMHVWEGPANHPERSDGLSAGALRDLRTLREFSYAGVVRWWSANITGNDIPERVRAVRVTSDFLRAVGRAPVLGRDFADADDAAGASKVVLLSYGLWQRRFGADRGIVGRVVRINGEGYTVRGVLPEDFTFPAGTQLLAPLGLSAEEWASRGERNLFALARLAPGVGYRQAEAAVRALGNRLAVTYPQSSAGWEMRAEPAETYFGSGPRPFMMVLLAAGAFVLLIACANVANLLLARAVARRRELAVRVALGASRGRIIRQALTESVLVALAGGALGVLLSLWGLDALAKSVPVEVRAFIPGFGQLRMNPMALVFTGLVSVGSGVLFGLVPAFAAARVDLQSSLKEGARGEVGGAHSGRMRSVLVVAEVALALVLLVGAAQTVATFRRLALTDPGFRQEGVLTLSVTLPAADYPRDSSVAEFYRQLEDRVAALPGVSSAGSTTVLPLSWNENRSGVEVEGRPPRRPEDAPRVGLRLVSPGYLRTLGIPLVEGRAPTPQDGPDAPRVGVASQAAARLLWPGEHAVGKRLRLSGGPWIEVVGVAGDVRGNPLVGGDVRPVLYLLNRQQPARILALVVRAAGDPVALTPLIQREIAGLDSRLAAGDVMPMRRVVLTTLSPQSATARTIAVAALVALVMASVGLYGVMAYTVTQRTQEIGVRMAMGATAALIVRLVLRQAMRLVAVGIAIGIVGAVALGRGLQAILVESKATDPVVIGGVALVLAAVALVASYLPALRATRVDPIMALRAE